MRVLRDKRANVARLYNALWYPALPFALLAASGANPRAWRERLGRSERQPASPLAKKRIWAHAASVGEVEALRPVLIRLTNARDDLSITLTTMTATGREAARRRLPHLHSWRLAPLDFAASVRFFLRQVQPHLILIAETELWPNFFIEGAAVGARIAIVNGRLSERSMHRYAFVQSMMANAIGCADQILVQTDHDAHRFRELGAPPARIIVTGNTKFDPENLTTPARQGLVDFIRGHPMLIAGSTAPGEERLILAAYRNLALRFSDLVLVLAPRHLERIAEVEAEMRASGLAYVKATALQPGTTDRTKILLLDTLGELRGLYRYATIAFVGGSIAPPRGGQNLAEPALVEVPVLFGPHYENHQTVGDALIAAGGGLVVCDEAQLQERCAAWLTDPGRRIAAGRAARAAIERMAAGAELTVRHLLPLLDTIKDPS
jgi:3-deoxy-D-manno-octulosonic-acid transferase